MPQYKFRNDKAPHTEFWIEMPAPEFEELVKAGGKIRRKSKLDGSQYTATAVHVQFDPGYTAIQSPATYPMVSDALGCHPTQAREFESRARSLGITGISYNENGDCIIADRSSRRKWCEARGIRDRNAGYSDPQ